MSLQRAATVTICGSWQALQPCYKEEQYILSCKTPVKGTSLRLHHCTCSLSRTLYINVAHQGFMLTSPSAGLTAICTLEPPHSTPISRMIATEASRSRWYSLSVRVCAQHSLSVRHGCLGTF